MLLGEDETRDCRGKKLPINCNVEHCKKVKISLNRVNSELKQVNEIDVNTNDAQIISDHLQNGVSY